MLTRICLIVAIIAGLAVGALNFIQVKKKITDLKTELSDTKTKLNDTETKLAKSESNLKKTTADLATTTKKFQDASAERDKANADKTAVEKRMQKAVDDLATANTTLKDAQASLEQWKGIGFTLETALNASKQIKEQISTIAVLQKENSLLSASLRKTEAELAFYKDPEARPSLPATLQGKVVVVDPKWDFVILNVGADQGVVENGELLVNRNGKLVAKVIVRNVEKDRCTANVVPGWKLGEVIEGDSVIPAKPASS